MTSVTDPITLPITLPLSAAQLAQFGAWQREGDAVQAKISAACVALALGAVSADALQTLDLHVTDAGLTVSPKPHG